MLSGLIWLWMGTSVRILEQGDEHDWSSKTVHHGIIYCFVNLNFDCEEGCRIVKRNVAIHLQECMFPHLRRPQYKYSPPHKPDNTC
jgi:hypothetical protein